MIFFYFEIGEKHYGPEVYGREVMSGIDDNGRVVFEYRNDEKPHWVNDHENHKGYKEPQSR